MAKRSKKPTGAARMDLRREVMQVFEKNPRKPLNHKQVASALGITDGGLRQVIFSMLAQEADGGALREVERGKFVLKDVPMDTAQGFIEINRFGKGYVAVEGLGADVEIAKGDTGFALYGDLVEVSYNARGRRPRGKVIRVVERLRKQYVGIIQQSKGHTFMMPGDRRLHVDFYIPKDDLNGAKHGEKVIVEMGTWDRPESSPFGRVVRVLGKPGDHQVEMHAIIAEYGLPYEFPQAVEEFADKIDPGFTPEEIAKRRDFRGILTFTIDPYDAKDFDDALSYRVLENGHVEVGVHIADVSFYMKLDTILEAEAFNRATSVYLVDRTIPMLPERLSNELCSLRPNEDKMCFSAVFEMNDKAEVVKEWFGRTVIHSDRRFTYEEAQEIIEKGTGDHAEAVLALDKLAKQLRARRFAEGSIDFNTEEVKFRLDEKGAPVGVFVKVMKDSNQLIEDFMLLANRRVAQFVGKNKEGMERTFVYRIHDNPDPDRIAQLRTFLKHLGYKLPRPTDSDSHNVIRELMLQVAGQPEEQIIRQMAIRTMAKAEYSTQNIGHYGLAFEYYTHFTSPIRRYPDVMVHRLLQHYLDGGASPNAGDYDLRCRHSSMMEKRAAEAERASIKYKQVEFMLMHRDQVFKGIVSGLASWGMYVEVEENKCEGLVAIQTLTDDIYEFEQEKYILRGLRKKREYHMGDEVMIRVVDGDLQQRTLNYELVQEKRPSR